MFSGGGTVRAFILALDNPSRSYFAGQLVTGRLVLDLDRERKTSGIKLNFLGRAKVHWTETVQVTSGTGTSRRTHTETRTYSDQETYFDQKVYVVGSSGGGDVTLPPGHAEFPFSFNLPMGIPSSFKGTHGHIQYSVTATLKKSWGFDKTVTTIFTVNAIVDLNTLPGASNPSQFTKLKHLGCLCCKDGPISYLFKLNRAGYVPGEGLEFLMEMTNHSTKPIRGVQIRLKRSISFHARGKSRNESDTVIGFGGPGVGPGDTEIWQVNPSQAKIPPIPPTNLGGCRIISVQYAVYVEMEIPAGFNLKGNTDILIGTIPFRNNFQHMRPPMPQPVPMFVDPAATGEGFALPMPLPLPSAPPLFIPGYPDLPPPSYEDAFAGGGLPTYEDAVVEGADGQEDGDDKKKQGIPYDPGFVPKYATYGWNSIT